MKLIIQTVDQAVGKMRLQNKFKDWGLSINDANSECVVKSVHADPDMLDIIHIKADYCNCVLLFDPMLL